MDFDLDTDQLQIRTDSDEGIIRVRFTDQDTMSGPGIKIGSLTPPTAKYTVYQICEGNSGVKFILSNTTTPRVWTVAKQAGKLILHCNGEQIFGIDLNKDTCEDGWSLNFARIVFPKNQYLNGGNADTASDFVRIYTSGMSAWLFDNPSSLSFCRLLDNLSGIGQLAQIPREITRHPIKDRVD